MTFSEQMCARWVGYGWLWFGNNWFFACWFMLLDWYVGDAIAHDDVIKWKHFPRNWPFVREIHRSPVNFPHKSQWRGALMFSLIYAWINDWVNNREAGDFRRQRGHYDVIVMLCADVRSMLSSDTIRRLRSKCTLTHVMACYLNQCQMMINGGICDPHLTSISLEVPDLNSNNSFDKCRCKIAYTSLSPGYSIWANRSHESVSDR